MGDDPIALEDELVSLASALLTAAEADAATPGSRLIFRPEYRPTPRVRSTASEEAKQAFSWASLVKELLSRAGVHVPAQHTSSSTSASASSTSTSPAAAPPTQGTTVPPRPEFVENAVAELLKRNRDVYDNVINHPFPRAFGEGTASLDGFRYYMIQDWWYMQICTQLKMISLGTGEYNRDVEEFDVQRKVKQTRKVMEICGTMLGVSKKTVETTPRSQQLLQSGLFYKTALLNENAWLGYYVVMLPCVLAYWEIADHLMKDASTAKNVVYYKAWIEEQHDYVSAKKYIKFINENIARAGGVDRWNVSFNEACQHEAQIFNTGLHAPVPFEVVPNGTYSIHTSSASSLVLAMQDVTHIWQRRADKVLDGYLPSDTALSVVGKEKTGGDDERWLISATKTGYTFKNVGTGLYLGMSRAPERGQYRVLQAVSAPYSWWVNPSAKQPDEGPSLYQIHDSENLRYTLHAAVEALNSVNSPDFTPIIAHDNSEAPSQMWSFNDYKFEKPQYTQIFDAKEAAAMIKQLEGENERLEGEVDLLQKKLEAVRLALDIDGTEDATDSDLSAVIEKEIGNLREAIEAGEAQRRKARKDERAAKRGLRAQHAEICHWESFRGDLNFDSSSFKPSPIVYGGIGGPAFIARYESDIPHSPVTVDGIMHNTVFLYSGHKRWGFQVLVGNDSRLRWIPIVGRFDIGLIGYHPVPGWDKKGGKASDALFIARCWNNQYNTWGLTTLKDGASVEGQRCEVLCYENWR